MPKKAKKTRRSRRLSPTTAPCSFCKKTIDPDYKDYKTLAKYLSERGKIINKDLTGLCSRHQRKLSKAIKQARNLGLLSTTPLIY